MSTQTESQRLTAVLSAVVELDDQIAQASEGLKELERKREELAQLAIETMAADGVQNIRINGRTLFLQRELSVSVPVDSREPMVSYLEQSGHGDLVETSIATARLKSLIREMRDSSPEKQLSEVVPAEILSLARVYEFTKLRNRKA